MINLTTTNITIDPDNGWLSKQPKATRDFYERKILKAQAEGNVIIQFAGEHRTITQAPNSLDQADHLGTVRAEDFATVAPWRGQER